MNQLWKAAGAAAWGAAALGGLQPFLGPESAEQLHTLCPGAQTVLVGAFPYYAGQALSLIHISEPTRRALLSRMPSSA